MIERQNFISDLFQANEFLNNFSDIEFESFKTFIDCKLEKFFAYSKQLRVHIPINDIKEFEGFVRASTESYFTEKLSIDLLIKSELLDEVFILCEVLKGKKFSITTDVDLKPFKEYRKIKGFRVWTVNNPLWIDLRINYDNYKLIPRQLAHSFNKNKYRHFKLSFDYESLEKLSFDELHVFENWMYMIVSWTESSGNVKEFKHPIYLYKNRINKTVYITSDLKMYVNKQAFEDNDLLFDLEKRKKDNGETIPNKELNTLRSYIDLNKEVFTIPLLKNYFVDLYQNKKIMGSYNQIPHLVRIVGELFARI